MPPSVSESVSPVSPVGEKQFCRAEERSAPSSACLRHSRHVQDAHIEETQSHSFCSRCENGVGEKRRRNQRSTHTITISGPLPSPPALPMPKELVVVAEAAAAAAGYCETKR